MARLTARGSGNIHQLETAILAHGSMTSSMVMVSVSNANNLNNDTGIHRSVGYMKIGEFENGLFNKKQTKYRE